MKKIQVLANTSRSKKQIGAFYKVSLNDFFSLPLQKIDDIFWMAAQTPTGKQIIANFQPFFRQGKIKIEAYPAEISKKLLEIRTPRAKKQEPAGASFITDGDKGTIYYDAETPVGVLVVLLMHEMVHSLDLSLWNLARKTEAVSVVEREKVILKSEIKAFEAQYAFLQEFKKRFPDAATVLMTRYPRSKILHERMDEKQISKMYQLSSTQVKAA